MDDWYQMNLSTWGFLKKRANDKKEKLPTILPKLG